jgi:hypothetical protein
MNALAIDLLCFVGDRRFATVLADPPWKFTNKSGKVAPEHKRLARYTTLSLDEILSLPVAQVTREKAHLYLWCPNALLPEGLAVMKAWGFTYKSNIVWHKVRKDGGPDGRGVGFYFRNVTELILFGIKGKNARTLAPGRRSQLSRGSQARAFAQAGRAIQDHRGLQSGAVPGIIRTRHPGRLGRVGQPGRRRLALGSSSAAISRRGQLPCPAPGLDGGLGSVALSSSRPRWPAHDLLLQHAR